MMCAEGMLCSYANAIEMAFAANLLVAAWASLYQLYKEQKQAMLSEADKFEQNPFIEEELSIRAFRKVIKRWDRIERFFWWPGLIMGVCSALSLYIIMWHVSSETMVGAVWRFLLMVAAYTGPISMMLMAVTGIAGGKHTLVWKKTLQKQVETNQAASEKKLREADQRILRRARRKPKPFSD